MAEAPVVTPKGPYQAKAFELTPEQVQQILKDANRTGFTVADRPMVVEETKLQTNPLDGRTEQVPTGRYMLNVKAPNTQQSQPVYLRMGGKRTVNTVGGPIQQEDWITEPPEDLAKPPTAAQSDTIKMDDGSVIEKVNGVWTVVMPATGGTAVKTALSQAELDDMKANETAGRGFMTTLDWQKLQDDARRTNLSAADLKEKIRQFDQDNKLKWETERRQGRVAEATIEHTRAQTGATTTETALNEQRLKDLIAAAPDDATKRRLTNELTQLSMDKTRQEMRQPTIPNLGNDLTYGVMTPEGTIEQRMNQGYVPKTMAEIAARTGQLDALARQKGQEIQAKQAADPNYSAEKAFADFNRWYDSNIQPQLGALDAATQEAQYARGKEMAATRQASLTSALAAGTQAIARYNASSGEGLDPELAKYHKSMGTGKMPTDVDPSKMFAGGDLEGKVARATAEGLKYIDQQAADLAGTQAIQYAQMNPRDVLNRTSYMPAGGPAPAAAPIAAGGGPAPVTAATTATTATTAEDPWAAWRARQTLDEADQRRGAEAMAAWNASQAPPAEELPPVPEAAIPPYVPQQRRPAPVPVRRGAPALLPAPGLGYDPSNIPINPAVTAPGFGYDPSSFGARPAQELFWPVPDETNPGPNPAIPDYQWQDPVIAAAQAAYRRVPRTNWR